RVRRPSDAKPHPESVEPRTDRAEVVASHVLDHALARRDRAEADEARSLDVIGPDAELSPAEPLDALDPEHVRAGPLDPGAEAGEEAAEILDVRLARGVADHGLAAGRHRRHDRVLGAGDA